MGVNIASSLGINPTVEGEKALRNLQALSEISIEVGFHEGQNADDGTTPLAAIAYWNHFGTVSEDGSVAIPPRPFMDALKTHEAELGEFCQMSIQASQNADESARQIGAKAVGMIQTEIVDGKWTPNAPSTIRKKKSDHPLIDTGRMRQEVHYVIKKGE